MSRRERSWPTHPSSHHPCAGALEYVNNAAALIGMEDRLMNAVPAPPLCLSAREPYIQQMHRRSRPSTAVRRARLPACRRPVVRPT